MELVLIVNWVEHNWDFEVIREIKPKRNYSVFIVSDWPYTPWPREGDNLLW
jgi:hypothetical protein